jgi:chromate reductase, NAD(P)H dehydrogenase (quinone)
MRNYNFVAIIGSLRKDSYNKMLFKAAQKILPENIKIEILPIDDVPLYNADLHEKNVPESVDKLNDAIKATDALIVVTPEYNYSIPGVLKNVIDHISSSPKKPFEMKAVGIFGASTSLMGTTRAQNHLRLILSANNAYVLNEPEILVSEAKKKFDENGNLNDNKTESMLYDFMNQLATLSDKLNNK